MTMAFAKAIVTLDSDMFVQVIHVVDQYQDAIPKSWDFLTKLKSMDHEISSDSVQKYSSTVRALLNAALNICIFSLKHEAIL